MGVPERGADCIMSSRSTAAWLTAGYSPREGSGVHPTYDTAQMSRLSYSPREGSELHRPDNAGQLDQGVIVPKRGADCIQEGYGTVVFHSSVTVPERGADCITQFSQLKLSILNRYSPREGSGLHRANTSKANIPIGMLQSPRGERIASCP